VGDLVIRRTLRRNEVIAFFQRLPSCRIGIEAWEPCRNFLLVNLVSFHFPLFRMRSLHHLKFALPAEQPGILKRFDVGKVT
jgi:hypothetical protein